MTRSLEPRPPWLWQPLHELESSGATSVLKETAGVASALVLGEGLAPVVVPVLQAVIASTEPLPKGATAPAPVSLAPASEVPVEITGPASSPMTPQPTPEALAELDAPPAVTRLAQA